MATAIDVGCEWVVDALGCDERRLRDLPTMRDVCQRVIDDLHLNVIGQPHWHQFPGHAGVTGLYLLSESHLACHTYPERQLATFNLYCCRSRCGWEWREQLTIALGAHRVNIVEIVRGQSAQPQIVHAPSVAADHWTGKEPV